MVKKLKQKLQKTIEQVKNAHEMALMKISGVEGVGISQEKSTQVIAIYTSQNNEKLKERIPEQIEGYRVKLISTGEFKAF
jgi:hypothetical protein